MRLGRANQGCLREVPETSGDGLRLRVHQAHPLGGGCREMGGADRQTRSSEARGWIGASAGVTAPALPGDVLQLFNQPILLAHRRLDHRGGKIKLQKQIYRTVWTARVPQALEHPPNLIDYVLPFGLDILLDYFLKINIPRNDRG